MDMTLLQMLAQGGAWALAVWLVIDTRREAAKREESLVSDARCREGELRSEALRREGELHAEIAALRLESQKREDRLMDMLEKYSDQLQVMAATLQEIRAEIAQLMAVSR